jgi:hypothetical protein
MDRNESRWGEKASAVRFAQAQLDEITLPSALSLSYGSFWTKNLSHKQMPLMIHAVNGFKVEHSRVDLQPLLAPCCLTHKETFPSK